MIIMAAALAGMLGPVLFVTVILALTALQYDFMLEIGWRPLADPADAWPSGLALGPYGPLQDANFVASGLLLALFATGQTRLGGRSRPASLGRDGDGAHRLRERSDTESWSP